jgi:transposase
MAKRSTRTRRQATNIVGVDPHKRTLTASVLDERGGVLGTQSFRVSGEGHRAMEAWALSFGPVARWGIEGASGLGRHTSMFLIRHGHDVRDVCPSRTAAQSKKRHQGKTDKLDSVRAARETQTDASIPVAFKRANGETGPDETLELLALWHKARCSLVKSRQHLLGEAEALLGTLPEAIRITLPDTATVRPRLRALLRQDHAVDADRVTVLRLEMLTEHAATIAELDRRDRRIAGEMRALNAQLGTTLTVLCGIAERMAAELLVEVGDPRRFAGEGGFARFNGTAPIPVSSGEGDGEPKRYRLNRGGNRRVNVVLHRMAITQLRCDERARTIYDDARRAGHTKREAMRILKRQLSNVVYRHMLRDVTNRTRQTRQERDAA